MVLCLHGWVSAIAHRLWLLEMFCSSCSDVTTELCLFSVKHSLRGQKSQLSLTYLEVELTFKNCSKYSITSTHLLIKSPYSWCFYSLQPSNLFWNGPLREEEGNVSNCVWNCEGGQWFAKSLCWPVSTVNMSEWRTTGFTVFTAKGLRDFCAQSGVWWKQYSILQVSKAGRLASHSLTHCWGQGILNDNSALGFCSIVWLRAAGVGRK